MAENIHVDLSEEIEQDIINIYEAYRSDLAGCMNQTYNSLENVCNTTQYLPIVETINTTIQLFNEEIQQLSESAFQEWLDGDGCFSAAARKSQAGDDAEGTASGIEGTLEQQFQEFWGNHPFGENVQVDTSRPKVKDLDYDELIEIYNKTFQDIEAMSEDAINSVKEKGQDDPTYNIMIPAMTALAHPIKNAFEQFVAKIDQAKSDSESIKQQQDTANEEAVEVATNTTADVDQISSGLSMFGDLV